MMFRVLLAASWLLTLLCQGQETITRAEVEESITKQVGVLVEFFSTDAKAAHALAAKDHEQPARVALTPMVAEGTAKIEEIAYILTRSGSQAQVESIIELIYPTEYHPPKIPQVITGVEEATDHIRTFAAPTAYQTRNLGLTLKVTPQVNRELIEFNLVIDQVEHTGTDTNGQLEALVTWPKFHSKQTTNNLITSSGKPKLVALLAPAKPESSQPILAFVTATSFLTMTVEQAAAMWFPEKKLVEGKPRAKQEDGDPFEGVSEEPFEEPDSLPDANVTLVIESIEVMGNLIPGLLETPSESVNATALREAISKLIKAGQASMKETQFVSSASSEKGQARSGNELIYAVEMSRPQLPLKVEGPLGGDIRLAIPMVYSSHEMRPDGPYLDFDLQLSPNQQVIDLSLSHNETRLLERVTYGKKLAEATMPLFATKRLSTNVSLFRGECSLLGITSQRAKDGRNSQRYTLHFATAHVR